MTWMIQVADDDRGGELLHVIPIEDLRPHDTGACWCKPQPDSEYLDVIVHNALDRREAFERGERLPS